MLTSLTLAFVTLSALVGYRCFSRWQRNYHDAVATGLPVFKSLLHISNFWWLVFAPIFTPILEHLPLSWTVPWLQLSQPWKIWKAGHSPFAQAGSDNLMIATPHGNMFWTADSAVIDQLLRLHPKVEQPLEMMRIWDIWGPTISSVDGEEWKAHRKAISAGFGPAMNRVVWEEARLQAEKLAEHWMKSCDATVPSIRYYTSRLALHVIMSGFFDKRLMWDDSQSTSVETGHRLSFHAALFTVLARLGTIFMVPKWLLRYLPGKTFTEAHLGYTELTSYFEEMRSSAAMDLESLAKKRNKTLLEAIVASAADPEVTGKRPLPQGAVIGNIFFTVLAGHETAGSTLGFALTLLAVYPELQQLVQHEIDNQFGNRPSTSWTLEEDFLPLHRGWVGAVQKETLYLYNPAQFLMRRVVQPVTVVDSRGKSFALQTGTFALINKSAEARNPAQWQRPFVSAERAAAVDHSPAVYFNPKRWLDATKQDDTRTGQNDQDEPGSAWSAFGAGGRTCPGRAFAQIEMTVVMATLLASYSLELIVPDEALRAHKGDKKAAWEKTQEKAIKMLYHDINSNVSISLSRDLPIQITRRGS